MATPSEYPVFELWYKTNDWILQSCDRMPKHIRFTVSGRIANLSLDTLSLIIEAIYQKERSDIIRRINLLLEQLRIFFRLSKDRQYISTRQYEFIITAINDCGKMLGGWQKSTNG